MPQAPPIRLTPTSWPRAYSAYPFIDCSDWIRINTLPGPAQLKRGRQCIVGRHHDEPDIVLFEHRFPPRPDLDDSGVTFQDIFPIEIAAAINENLRIAGKTVDHIPAPLICCENAATERGNKRTAAVGRWRAEYKERCSIPTLNSAGPKARCLKSDTVPRAATARNNSTYNAPGEWILKLRDSEM